MGRLSGTPHKRHRATRAELQARRDALVEIVLEDGPMSVRQAYYRAVVHAIVPKNANGYERVQRDVLWLRREHLLPYEMVVDYTRWMRKPRTWDSAKDALVATAQLYRQAMWSRSPYRPEVWVESDSIAGSVMPVTEAWDVPLMSCRGQSSETFAYKAAEDWVIDDRLPVVAYIGDHDPAGLEIEASIRTKLHGFAGWSVEWARIGVTWDQVVEHDLPGTSPKKAYGFPVAVEAEALPPQMLRDLLDDWIEGWADPDELRALRAAEESEREVLERMAGSS